MTACGLGVTPDPSSSSFYSEYGQTTTRLDWKSRDSMAIMNDFTTPTPGRILSATEPLCDNQLGTRRPLRRSASKSISSFRSGAHEIGSLVRRMSLSLRSKGNKNKHDSPNASNATMYMPEPLAQLEASAGRPKPSSWFRTQRPHRRPSLPLLNNRPSLPILTQDSEVPFSSRRPSITALVPGTGPLPPIVPNNLNNGAAARAAAAAQNEAIAESNKTNATAQRSTDLRPLDRVSDLKLTRDSESGIGIDMRDQSEMPAFDENLVRRDPAHILPTEIMEQILSYLDPVTLISAESASSAWHGLARSRHVWRHTFHQVYDKCNIVGSMYPGAVRRPAAGLGKRGQDQDWKKMYRVRRALEQRWDDGQAAAIYLNGHKDSVYCVQFDEHKIITGSRDQTIRVWDARTYQCLKVIGEPISHSQHHVPSHWSPPRSPHGLVPMFSINTTGRDPTSRRGSVEPADCHKASILCLQFDNDIMVTGSSDSTCIVWSITKDYTPTHRLRGHSAGVLDVCFDSRYIITCSKDTTICVWDRHTGDLIKRLSGHRGPVNAVQLKGDLVVSASGDGIAKLWNLTSGLCIKEFPSRDRGLACVEFSDDGKTILAGGNDQVIYQFDANTAELVRELKGHKGLVRSLHLDNINNRIISGSYDMSIKVWDVEKQSDVVDGGVKLDFQGWTTSWILAAKSDYRRVVATSQDGRAVILDFGYGLDGIELLEG